MPLRVRGSAGVLLEAVGGADVVVVACVDALAAPFGAHVVGYAQTVLGDIGLLVVAAETAVCQGYLGRISILLVQSRCSLKRPQVDVQGRSR